MTQIGPKETILYILNTIYSSLNLCNWEGHLPPFNEKDPIFIYSLMAIAHPLPKCKNCQFDSIAKSKPGVESARNKVT